MVIHQGRQLAFAGDHVGEVQARKLILPGWRRVQQATFYQPLKQPVVPGPLVFKFQRTDAVRDLLQSIFNRMRIGVHRIDAPFVAGVVVFGTPDAVNGRVAHIYVGAGHVYLGPQHHGAVEMFGVAHFPKTRQILCRDAIPKRAVNAGLAEVPPVGAHVFGALLVHVGMAGFDQVLRRPVHEIKVITCVIEMAGAIGLPVKTQPAHRVDDAVHELLFLLFGVGIVKPQVAYPTVITRQPEVHADALGVANMQVTVGLWRKTRADPGRVGGPGSMVCTVARAAAPAARGVRAGGQVGFYRLAQKVAWF